MSKRRRGRALAAIAVAAVTGLGLAGWAYATRPIRIGLAVSPATSIGYEAILSIHHYLDTHPQIGRRPVELVVEAPSLDAADQRRAIRALDAAGVSVILGAAVSQVAAVQAEEAQRLGLPVFAVSASTSDLTGRADAFFRLVVDTEAAGALAATLIGASAGDAKLAILTGASNVAYTEALGAAVERHAPGALRVSLADEPAALDAVRRFGPRAIFLAVPPDALLRLTKTLREQCPEATLYSSDWGLFALALYSPDNFEGVQFVTQNGTPTARYQELLDGFAARYEHTPAHTAAYCFSILDLLYGGLEAAGDERAALLAWLRTPRTYPYAYGRVALDACGDAIREHHYRYAIEAGALRLVERRRVAQFPDPPEASADPGGPPR